MDKRNKISFIPQNPTLKKSRASRRPISLMLTLSFIFFFLTLAVYGGMFFYANKLEKSVKSKELVLSSAKQKLDPDRAMENAQEFQKKMNNIEKLLNLHIAPSVIFGLLEDITLKSIKFDTYKFSEDKNKLNQNVGENKVKGKTSTTFSVILEGEAPSYASVAFQSDIIKKEIKENKRISSFSISNVSLSDAGDVLFELNLNILPAFLSYKNAVQQGRALTVSGIDKKTTSSVKDIEVPSSIGVEGLNNLLKGN